MREKKSASLTQREHECEREKRASIPLGAVVAFDGDNGAESHCAFGNLLAAQLALRAIRLGVLHGMLERHYSCDCSSSPGCASPSLQHQTLHGVNPNLNTEPWFYLAIAESIEIPELALQVANCMCIEGSCVFCETTFALEPRILDCASSVR
jgi:hypothetical protein